VRWTARYASQRTFASHAAPMTPTNAIPPLADAGHPSHRCCRQNSSACARSTFAISLSLSLYLYTSGSTHCQPMFAVAFATFLREDWSAKRHVWFAGLCGGQPLCQSLPPPISNPRPSYRMLCLEPFSLARSKYAHGLCCSIRVLEAFHHAADDLLRRQLLHLGDIHVGRGVDHSGVAETPSQRHTWVNADGAMSTARYATPASTANDSTMLRGRARISSDLNPKSNVRMLPEAIHTRAGCRPGRRGARVLRGHGPNFPPSSSR
jgi:hypothetical protein